MKRISILFIVAICVFSLSDRLNAPSNKLVDISKHYTSNFVKVNNAEVEVPTKGMMLVKMQKQSPLVELYAAKGFWNLSSNTSIAFKVHNVGNTDLALNCHIGDHQWSEGLLLLSPGEKGLMRVLIKGNTLAKNHPFLELYKDMKGVPGGFLPHWVKLDAAHVKKIKLSLINSKSDASFLISEVVSEGNLNTKTLSELKKTAYPFVDKYGQYSQVTWKGKVKSDKDFKRLEEIENQDLKSNPSSSQINKYGGWTFGPNQKSTGHFRTEKIDGKWWLVDPEGCLFWSHGITGVGKGAAITRVKGRENYFSELPAPSSPLFQFAKKTKQGKIDSFNFTAANLYIKYGTDWEENYKKKAHKRLRSWGMNTLGNWSDPSTYLLRKTPYTVSVNFRWKSIGGKLKFPNVYHPNYKKDLRKVFKSHKETWNDDYCIGYFVDNELHGWGKMGDNIVSATATNSAKVELIKFLKNKYAQIEKLNLAWNQNFTSWNDLLKNKKKVKGKKARVDLLGFEKILVDVYYKTCREIIKEEAPNKLYLGSRLHNHYYPEDLSHQKWIVPIAAKYCDVISFNRYRFSPHDLQPHSKTIDKPIIIGEFHFGALDRGMLHTGLRSVQNQDQRGKAYIQYIKGALENPYIVGAHWFQYGEQAVTGRGDGENYQIGFLDVCDQPYQETIEGCRKIGYEMYSVRMKANEKNTK